LRLVAFAADSDGGAVSSRLVDEAGDALKMPVVDDPAVIRAFRRIAVEFIDRACAAATNCGKRLSCT